ncbi:hypothetical protein E1B28_000102 [Marasmius oreades]|uniref:DUF6534 domain-containing protein n=1 Tax=Marasmius oreades TaxID=181124 RepID=A0A9P7V0Q9_9AGAR|nr:uncharacterized protein E1B28_000102 [Marasmius oreades]KAG7098131.1 hypothetical protein E1B28_000102 [Marasmius oreades]
MSSSAGLPSPLLTGPPIVALSINCMLFAVLTIQIYVYEVRFPRDPRSLKIFVWLVYIGDLVQLILLHMFCWDVSVTGLAVQGGAPTPQPNAGAHTMMTSVIAAMIQGFFAWRIYSLRRDSVIDKIVAVIIILLALLQCIACLLGVSLFFAVGTKAADVANLERFQLFPQIWLISSVVCDLLIAVAMSWILIAFSRASEIKRTRSILQSLILRSVETGTVTFVFTLVNLILFLKMPENYVYMVFDRTLSKLYSNALFLSLNARQSGADVSTTNWSDNTRGSFGMVHLSSNRLSRHYGANMDTLQITTDTVTDHTETQLDSQVFHKGSLKSDV